MPSASAAQALFCTGHLLTGAWKVLARLVQCQICVPWTQLYQAAGPYALTRLSGLAGPGWCWA